MIDIKSKGLSNYDLEELIKFYKQSPKILKQSTNAIIIANTFMGNRTGAQYDICEDTFKEGKNHPLYGMSFVNIYNPAFYIMEKDGNPQLTLYHEMGHCFNSNILNGKSIQNDKRYREICKKEGFSSDYARNTFNESGYKEDIAETIAMVCFKNINKKNANIILDNKTLSYEEFVEKFPEKVKYFEELLDL